MTTFNRRVEKVTKHEDGTANVTLYGAGFPMTLVVADARPFKVGAAVTIIADDTPALSTLTDDWPGGGNAR